MILYNKKIIFMKLSRIKGDIKWQYIQLNLDMELPK